MIEVNLGRKVFYWEVVVEAPFFRRLWVTISCAVISFYAGVINRFQIVGAENIPASGGVMIAANHISGFDTVFIPAAVSQKHRLQMVWAPAKEELFRNSLVGTFYRSLGAFPVKRGRDVRAGKHLGGLLQTQKVMLFPEGTRNKDGVLGKGNRGVGKLIYEHRPVVIPTALSGINKWQVFKSGQQGGIHFGVPIDFSDLFELKDEKTTHIMIVERLMTAIANSLDENI